MDMLYCPVEHADFEQPIKGKVRLGDLLFYSVLSNANTPRPNQPTAECLQVARQRCLDRTCEDHSSQASMDPVAPLKSDRVAFQGKTLPRQYRCCVGAHKCIYLAKRQNASFCKNIFALTNPP